MDGTQDQRLALVFQPQTSGPAFPAASATEGVVVGGLAYQDLALDVNGLCGSQELKGLECETGIGTAARDDRLVGAVHGTPKGGTNGEIGEYYQYDNDISSC